MNNYKLKIILIVIITALSFFFFYKNQSTFYYQEPVNIFIPSSSNSESASNISEQQINNAAANDTNFILIYVSGGVKKTGVIKCNPPINLADVISRAGGLDENAIYNPVKYDGIIFNNNDTVIIPVKLDYEKYQNKFKITNEIFGNLDDLLQRQIIEIKIKSAGQKLEEVKIININTATAEEIMALPRVGKKTAETIIEYREKNGKFKTIEEITNVPGIGPKKFELFKTKITVK